MPISFVGAAAAAGSLLSGLRGPPRTPEEQVRLIAWQLQNRPLQARHRIIAKLTGNTPTPEQATRRATEMVFGPRAQTDVPITQASPLSIPIWAWIGIALVAFLLMRKAFR